MRKSLQFRLTAYPLALLFAVAFMLSLTVAAPPPGKGGGGGGNEDPPEPTPPGTIYYQIQTETGAQTWGMDGDGNNKFQALPQGTFGNPSSLLYGPDGDRRWWLIAREDGQYDRVIGPKGQLGGPSPHYNLYAVAWVDGELVWQKLCDSYGKFIFLWPRDGSFNGWDAQGGFYHQWSSEGIDRSAYGRGMDIEAAFRVEEDGSTTIDLQVQPNNTSSLARIDVPDQSMTLGQSAEAGIVLGPEALTVVPGDWTGGNLAEYHFSPDDEIILSEQMVEIDEGSGVYYRQLQLRDTTTGELIDTRITGSWQAARWSPSGGEIVFADLDDEEGVFLLQADETGFGNSLQIFAPGRSRFTFVTAARWSPSAAHVLFRQIRSKDGWHLYRMKADGSGVLKLTGDLDDGVAKWPFRWVTNDPAPAP